MHCHELLSELVFLYSSPHSNTCASVTDRKQDASVLHQSLQVY